MAGHGVAQKPLIGRFLPGWVFEQVEFPLLADELLPYELDASGQGDVRAGREPETQVVGPAGSRRTGRAPRRHASEDA